VDVTGRRRSHTARPSRRHPATELLSRYLDGDIASEERRAVDAHVRKCGRCRELLDSLADTVHALGFLKQPAPSSVADSVIDALRAETPSCSEGASRRPQAPSLSAVGRLSQPRADDRSPGPWSQRAQVALAYCLRRPQLRLTLPLALLAGAILTLVNMGGQLMDGRIDLGMCAMCAADFLVPFIALNVALLILWRTPADRRR